MSVHVIAYMHHMHADVLEGQKIRSPAVNSFLRQKDGYGLWVNLEITSARHHPCSRD